MPKKEQKKTKYHIFHFWMENTNVLLSNSTCGDKTITQRKEIKKFIKKNSNNYWLNTAGFESLISDLK